MDLCPPSDDEDVAPAAKSISTLIVDGEPLARERLRALLAGHADIDVVGEARDGEEAVAAIRGRNPDLVFLAVDAPRMDGFEVIRAVGGGSLPLIVLVAAGDEHARKAFDARALDYLVKPLDRDRFAEAIGRARDAIARARGPAPRRPAPNDRMVIKSAGRLFFLRIEEIDWIEAAGNYVKLHVGADEHLLRETMNGIERTLDADTFLRIHRSRIVNMERVTELQPWFNGEYIVILQNGTKLTLSRGYREKLQERLGRTL